MLMNPQMTTLQALVDRIIPPDEDPGGWEAGVGDYLLRQFEGDLKDALERYRQGLDALDVEAQTVAGKHFAASRSRRPRMRLLTQIEQGKVQTEWPLDPAAFFSMACHHCAEGYYSDPGNGGNREGIVWQMIGFEVRG